MRVSVGVKKLTLLRPIGDVKWCSCCEKQSGVPQKVKKNSITEWSRSPTSGTESEDWKMGT